MKETKDWLYPIEIVGKILVLTPIAMALPLLIYAILSGRNIGIEDAGGGFSAGTMIIAGLIMIVYVILKRR
jgi:hypothetical protein